MIMMLVSIPFSYFGFYCLKSDNGTKILGTARFWLIGLTKEYGDMRQYFFVDGPHFFNAVVVLLIISILFMLAFSIVQMSKKSLLTQKQEISLSFIFSLLTHGFYAAAVIITILFYANLFHASYTIQGHGRLGVCPIIAIILQFPAVWAYAMLFIEFVLPHRKPKEEEDEEEIPASKVAVAPPAAVGPRTPFSPRPQVVPPPPPVHHNSVNAFLMGYDGEYKGGKIKINENEEILIGKDSKICSVVIDEKYKKVSRKHCGISRKGYDIFIKDYSTNGTYLSFDKTKIPSGVSYKLESGQRFNLAKTDNEFYCQIE